MLRESPFCFQSIFGDISASYLRSHLFGRLGSNGVAPGYSRGTSLISDWK